MSVAKIPASKPFAMFAQIPIPAISSRIRRIVAWYVSVESGSVFATYGLTSVVCMWARVIRQSLFVLITPKKTATAMIISAHIVTLQ
jgi:hypothetical protein